MHGVILGLGLVLALLLPQDAQATVVKAHSLYEKTQISKIIVRAKVESVQAEWFNGNTSVQTVITLKVSEVLKGKIPKSRRIQVRQAGGKIGDFDHRVEGVSRWETNEDVIMFLEPVTAIKNRQLFVELGIGIGKYEIKTSKTGQWVHHHPQVALAFVSGDQPMHVEPASKMKPIALKTFLVQVREFVTGKRKPNKRPKRPLPNQSLKTREVLKQ